MPKFRKRQVLTQEQLLRVAVESMREFEQELVQREENRKFLQL